jgi:hypothetical protein
MKKFGQIPVFVTKLPEALVQEQLAPMAVEDFVRLKVDLTGVEVHNAWGYRLNKSAPYSEVEYAVFQDIEPHRIRIV